MRPDPDACRDLCRLAAEPLCPLCQDSLQKNCTLTAEEREAGTVGERLVQRVLLTQTLLDDNENLRAENASLREAIRRLADQDATLSVCDGAVTVTMDATLTDAEREAIEVAAAAYEADHGERFAAVLRRMLERLT